ncbi:hypothetical protein [Streptomyces fradiae]|uniref:hypothetical protein n=1 Tax=Streptomyces fradiae TaxID=1906 RepID=UPI00378AD114
MGLKKALQETPLGQLVVLAAELDEIAKDFSFEKTESGGRHASATFNTMRVVVEWGGPEGFSLRLPPVKTIPGEVKKPTRKR